MNVDGHIAERLISRMEKNRKTGGRCIHLNIPVKLSSPIDVDLTGLTLISKDYTKKEIVDAD